MSRSPSLSSAPPITMTEPAGPPSVVGARRKGAAGSAMSGQCTGGVFAGRRIFAECYMLNITLLTGGTDAPVKGSAGDLFARRPNRYARERDTMTRGWAESNGIMERYYKGIRFWRSEERRVGKECRARWGEEQERKM